MIQADRVVTATGEPVDLRPSKAAVDAMAGVSRDVEGVRVAAGHSHPAPTRREFVLAVGLFNAAAVAAHLGFLGVPPSAGTASPLSVNGSAWELQNASGVWEPRNASAPPAAWRAGDG